MVRIAEPLRQLGNLPGETHGFASRPRGRFAFVVLLKPCVLFWAVSNSGACKMANGANMRQPNCRLHISGTAWLIDIAQRAGYTDFAVAPAVAWLRKQCGSFYRDFGAEPTVI